MSHDDITTRYARIMRRLRKTGRTRDADELTIAHAMAMDPELGSSTRTTHLNKMVTRWEQRFELIDSSPSHLRKLHDAVEALRDQFGRVVDEDTDGNWALEALELDDVYTLAERIRGLSEQLAVGCRDQVAMRRRAVANNRRNAERRAQRRAC